MDSKNIFARHYIKDFDPNMLHKKDLEKVSNIFEETENRYADDREADYIYGLKNRIMIYKHLKIFMKQIGLKVPKFEKFYVEHPEYHHDVLEFEDRYKNIYAYQNGDYIIMRIFKKSCQITLSKESNYWDYV